MAARVLFGSILLATAATAAAQEESLCDPCVEPADDPATVRDIEARASRPQAVDTAMTIEELIRLAADDRSSDTEPHRQRVEAFLERMHSAEAE